MKRNLLARCASFWAAGLQTRKPKDESAIITEAMYPGLPRMSVDHLPMYDKADGIRHGCMFAIGFTYVLSIACIGFGTYAVERQLNDVDVVFWPSFTAELWMMKLSLSVIVSIVMDALGYTHSVSLRWSLWHEGRLKFNSNIRFFTSSRRTFANSRLANIAVAVSYAFVYAATSCALFWKLSWDEKLHLPELSITWNGISILTIGVCLLLQSATAHLCFKDHSKRILSWSSDPLNTALACIHNGLRYHDGNSLVSVHRHLHRHLSCDSSYGVIPSKRQPSLRSTDKSVRHTTRLIWALSLICGLIGIITVLVVEETLCKRSLYRRANCSSQSLSIYLGSVSFFSNALEELAILYMLVLPQTLAALTIHCAEVIANRSRDEKGWRMAQDSRSGIVWSENSFQRACKSWQTIFLFFFKPLIHWLYGMSFSMLEGSALQMNSGFTFIMSAAFLILGCFVAGIANYRPKGPQPVAYGHIQTLANLIDDWGEKGDQGARLFWGDKGLNPDGTRRAGTSNRKTDVSRIVMNALYK